MANDLHAQIFGIPASPPGLGPPAPAPADDLHAAIFRKPRSAFGEIGSQAVGGLVGEVPKQAGQALQYISEPGQPLYETGKGWAEAAEKRLALPEYQPHPEEHGAVVNALASGARMLAPSVAAPLAVGAGLAALPEAAIGGTAALGLSALAGSVPAALQQGQQTLEDLRAQGVPEEDARAAARRTAAIEGTFEAGGTYLGGKLLGIGRKAISGAVGKGVSTGEAALAGATAPGLVRPFVKQLGETTAGEIGTEIAQAGGEAAVEQAYGGKGPSPLEAAQQVVAPTAGLTLLLAPLGLAGFVHGNRVIQKRATELASEKTDPAARAEAADAIAREIHPHDPAAAAQFHANVMADIRAGTPIALGPELLGPRAAPARPPLAPAPVPGPVSRALDSAGASQVSTPGTPILPAAVPQGLPLGSLPASSEVSREVLRGTSQIPPGGQLETQTQTKAQPEPSAERPTTTAAAGQRRDANVPTPRAAEALGREEGKVSAPAETREGERRGAGQYQGDDQGRAPAGPSGRGGARQRPTVKVEGQAEAVATVPARGMDGGPSPILGPGPPVPQRGEAARVAQEAVARAEPRAAAIEEVKKRGLKFKGEGTALKEPTILPEAARRAPTKDEERAARIEAGKRNLAEEYKRKATPEELREVLGPGWAVAPNTPANRERYYTNVGPGVATDKIYGRLISPQQYTKINAQIVANRGKAAAQSRATKLVAAQPRATKPVVAQKEVGAEPRAQGAPTAATTPKGQKVGLRYQLIEAADLVASHDAEGKPNPAYPAVLQPRDRSRQASTLQIQRIAGNLAPERLGASPTVSEGAPIIGPDNAIESGNGRVLALRKVYSGGGPKMQAYRAHLRENAEKFGLTSTTVEAMKAPVLVRSRTTKMTDAERAAFARDANESTTARMSPAEEARADAARVTLEDYHPGEDGNVLAMQNRGFVKRFISGLAPEEAAALTTAEGAPTKQLADRIRAAVFYSAYRDERLLGLFAEEADPEIRGVIAALNRAAPEFARARSISEDLGPYNIVPAIVEAADIIRQARAANQAVTEAVAQQGLFGAQDPNAQAIALFMDQNKRSAKRLGEGLRAMAGFIEGELRKAGNLALFAEAPPTLGDVITRVNQYVKEKYGQENAIEPDLFSQPERREPVAAPRADRGKPKEGEPIRAAAAPAKEAVAPERRTDITRRKAIADMSPEEMRRELLTDDLTGLGNRRAWEEADKGPVLASLDMDALKWVNDHMGHASGDKMLAAMGEVLNDVMPGQAFHVSGDEFLAHFEDQKRADRALGEVADLLNQATVSVRLPDGTTITKTGVGYSYGTGTNLQGAEAGLQRHKAERERAGLRAARGGEPAGVARTAPEGQPDRGREAAKEAVGPRYSRGAAPAKTPTFETLGNYHAWLDAKAKEHGGKNKFYSSEEYRAAYSSLKEQHKRLRDEARKPAPPATQATKATVKPESVQAYVPPKEMPWERSERFKGVEGGIATARASLVSQTLGRKFGQSMEDFLAGNPDQKRRHDAAITYLKEKGAATKEQLAYLEKERTPRYSYLGKEAKLADHSALGAAIALSRTGTEMEDIREKTGWFLGPDSVSEFSGTGVWPKLIQDSSVPQDGVDRVPAYSKLLSDLLESKTFKAKGLGGFDVPTQRLMLSVVLSAVHNAQIRDDVIKSLSIDVVNNLRARKLAPEVLFNNMPMLGNLLTVHADNSIPISVNVASSLARKVARSATKLFQTDPKAFPSGDPESLPAIVTNDRGAFSVLGKTGQGAKEQPGFTPLDVAPGPVDGKSAYMALDDRHTASDKNVLDSGILAQNIKQVTSRPIPQARWRFELSDKESTLKPGWYDAKTIGEAFQHDKLFENYPPLADIGFSVEVLPAGTNGYFDPKRKKVVLNAYTHGEGALDAKAARSVLLHELQHVVQNIERFSGGGSPDSKAVQALALKRWETERAPLTERLNQLSRLQEAWTQASVKDGTYPGRGTAYIAYREKHPGYASEADKLVKQLDDLDLNRIAHRTYRRLLGEVEARDVQFRADMGEDERRLIEPYVSQGIEERDFITNLKGEGKAESRGEPAVRAQALHTVASLKAELREALGAPATARLLRSTLGIVERDEQLPPSLQHRKGGVRGVFDPRTGKTWFVAGNVHKGEAKGLALHEIGTHAGMESMLGPKLWAHVLGQVEGALGTVEPPVGAVKAPTLPQRYSPEFVAAVKAARARVPEDTRAGLVTEETLANLVEDPANHDLPLVRRILAAIRAWLIRQGIPLRNITAADLAQLAAAAVRRVSRGETVQRGQVPAYARAYHGSPHQFEKFDISKIGTGEGAQSYGHGLYFAENPEVANQYRFNLAGTSKAHKFATDELFKSGGDIDKAILSVNDKLRKDPGRLYLLDAKSGLDDIKAQKAQPQPGVIYQVDIPDEHIAKMLDWDKPLSEQPEWIRKRLTPLVQRAIKEEFTTLDDINEAAGSDAYSALTDQAVGWETGSKLTHQEQQAAASEALRKMGVPGIKYLDQGSRAAGQGTRNFVVFDPSIVTILDRNGEKLKGAEKQDAIEELQAQHPETVEGARYSRGAPPPGGNPAAPPNPFTQENRRLREEDKTTWNRAKKFWQRNFTPGGLLPDDVFKEKIIRDNELGVVEFDTSHLVGQLDHAVKRVYGKRMEQLTKEQRETLQSALTGNPESLDPRVRTVIEAMRQHVDRMSGEYVTILEEQIADLTARGDPAAAAKAGILQTITGNLGRYVHRSYRAFDDPQWFSKLPDEVIDAARTYLRERNLEGGMSLQDAEAQAERALHTIVKTGTAYDSMESFIREGKLGAKDLTILIKRKDIAPEIRALLGEYDDPRLNYAKSTSKMGRLIWNQRFLDRVREIGMGTFLFEERDAPPGATTKIAADASEVYSPLNGLWTFPEIETAFKDAVGKEKMADWYRVIVQMNGLVKYGKSQSLESTVYTPTGPKRMGDIRVGDRVCGINGATYVLGIYPQGELETFKVHFADGAETEATAEHLWQVIGPFGYTKYTGVFTTEQIAAWPEKVLRDCSVPLAIADFDEKPVPLDPYLLGAILGNGSIVKGSPKFSTPDMETVEQLRQRLPESHKIEHISRYDYSITALSKKHHSNLISSGLRDLDLWGKRSYDKFIPEIYRYNSTHVRMNLLRGLLDTDGWVVRDGQPGFSTASKQLALDVREVAESLGATVLWDEKTEPKYTYKGELRTGRTAFMLKFRVPDAPEWFCVSRKKDLATFKRKPVRRTFRGIEPAGTKLCQCIRVADPASLYLTDRFVVTHNTILSPTTSARNWMSAAFFAFANGHFDLRHVTKSISGLREYFSHGNRPAELEYLRKLKRLGVVYDTAYTGEMMQLIKDSRIDEILADKKSTPYRMWRDFNSFAKKAYQYGDDFWKIIGFENEKAMLMGVGVPEAQAETEAADRIRNTYPTYSMVGRGVRWLARFPVTGAFVSFPAEILRTTGNMLRTVTKDYQDPQRRPLAIRRAVGMAMVSGFAYGLQALTMAMFGVDDDEEEAVRRLAAPWQKNSNLLFTGRDEEGKLRYFDLSFLDPYNWWKRPITAMLRDQPWEDKAVGALRDMLSPFLGTDIAAGALFEVLANKKESGGPVFNEFADPVDQSVAIANHLRKALQPGFVGNLERTYRAAKGEYTPSGKKYSLADEGMSWIGWRPTTLDPKTSLYYRSFEFADAKKAATATLNRALATPNEVSQGDIASAKGDAQRQLSTGFQDMHLIIEAAKKSGLSRPEIIRVLRTSGVSMRDIPVLLSGREPKLAISPQQIRNAAVKASAIYGPEKAREIQRRYREAVRIEAAP